MISTPDRNADVVDERGHYRLESGGVA